MRACIDVMSRTFEVLASGDVVQPLRSIMWLPNKVGGLGVMPGYQGGEVKDPDGTTHAGIVGIKVVTVFPGNESTPYESHQGSVMLFEPQHGRPLAIIDAGEITTIRTAAVSAVATRHLARKEAASLAILGSGTQAFSHVQAMLEVRPIRRLRVWSRNGDNARRLIRRASEKLPALANVDVETCSDAADAVRDADIVCTTTGAREPVLLGEWLSPGTHINAVGACIPVARELDSAAVTNARLFVDWRDSALHEAGDLLTPMRAGAIDASHIQADLAEVVTAQHPGRTSDDDVTLFKSLGIAVEDIAAAWFVYSQAQSRHLGTMLEMGGGRDAHA